MGWDVVGYQDEPIPTNVPVVTTETERLRVVQARIREQAARLRSAGDAKDSWKSDAADNFRKVVEQLPGQLEALADRYQKVAGALSEFASVAAGTKAVAEEGRAEAERAQAERHEIERLQRQKADAEIQARREADRINAANPGAPVPPQTAAGPWSWRNLPAEREAAINRLSAAVVKARGAVDRFHGAADQARRVIDGAINDSMANETGWWAAAKRGANWLTEHIPLEKIASIASTVAAVAGILALFVPGPWSVAFAAVAFVAGAVALAANLVQMLAKSHRGESVELKDWIQLGLDVVAMVPAAGTVAKAWKGYQGSMSLASTAFRGSRGIDLLEHGVNFAGGAKNTYFDVVDGKKDLGQALLDPGSVLWAGVGIGAGETLPKLWPGQMVDAGSGLMPSRPLMAERGELLAERVKAGTGGSGALAGSGSSFKEMWSEAELADRARRDAEVFAPRPIGGDGAAPEPVPVPTGAVGHRVPVGAR
jgi:hypothetical protein